MLLKMSSRIAIYIDIGYEANNYIVTNEPQSTLLKTYILVNRYTIYLQRYSLYSVASVALRSVINSSFFIAGCIIYTYIGLLDFPYYSYEAAAVYY